MEKFVWNVEALLKFPSVPECLVSVLREKTLISFQDRAGKVVWPGGSECTLQKCPCGAAHYFWHCCLWVGFDLAGVV